MIAVEQKKQAVVWIAANRRRIRREYRRRDRADRDGVTGSMRRSAQSARGLMNALHSGGTTRPRALRQAAERTCDHRRRIGRCRFFLTSLSD